MLKHTFIFRWMEHDHLIIMLVVEGLFIILVTLFDKLL